MVFEEYISHPFPFIHQNFSLMRDWDKDSKTINGREGHKFILLYF